MSARSRLLVAALVVALAVAGCTSAQPTATPGLPSAAESTAPSAPGDSGSAAATTPASEAPATPSPTASGLASDPLHQVTLTDVRTGTDFTLGQLAADKPVLLEAMAIWCTNCRAQMHRVVEAHASGDFHSVGVDVDASEVAGDLAAYVDEQGFDWPFAMADAELANLLRDRFGNGFLFPPNTPMAVLLPDGTVHALDFGGLSVEELLAELGAG